MTKWTFFEDELPKKSCEYWVVCKCPRRKRRWILHIWLVKGERKYPHFQAYMECKRPAPPKDRKGIKDE